LNGTIELGETCCDGFLYQKLGTITHFHEDHIFGLIKSWIRPKICLMSEPTFDLINFYYPQIDNLNVKIINYNQKFHSNNVEIELLPADHVLGSAQILYANNFRVLYSSDFILNEKTEIPEDIDLLIIDATYGHPSQIRAPIQIIVNLISNIINNALKNNLPVYFFTHQGKIQETMTFLHDECDINIPILLSKTSYEIAKIYEKFNRNLGEYFTFNSYEGTEIFNSKNFISFIDNSNVKKLKSKILKNSIKITLNGWLFNKAVIKIGKNRYSIALSGHADFPHLLNYIKLCDPKFVITDNFRLGSATELSNQIEKQLNIKSIPLPIKI